MEPRNKIIECIDCTNIVKCWGLDINHIKKNPAHYEVTFGSRLKLAIGLIIHKFTMRKLHISFIHSYINSLISTKSTQEDIENISKTSVCVTEALLNCSTDCWECPEEYKFNKRI